MQKIISLFMRNYDTDHLVRNEVVPGAEWVLAGEGVATRKFDGTCCMVRDGKLYKRYDAKRGKTPPAGFEPAQEPDPVTGHHPGWLPIGDAPEDRWFKEAWFMSNYHVDPPPDGTYELIGPKVQSDAEREHRLHYLPATSELHMLVRHGFYYEHDCPRDFDGIKAYLAGKNIEGIVWHHPDGRMVKIKARDFGIKRGVVSAS